jgi:hypothetical protein
VGADGGFVFVRWYCSHCAISVLAQHLLCLSVTHELLASTSRETNSSLFVQGSKILLFARNITSKQVLAKFVRKRQNNRCVLLVLSNWIRGGYLTVSLP